jgi:dinuclear metal center YbgI/SA1388 family protein
MAMTELRFVCDFLESFAPPHLAEEWDNVGLLVGNRERPVRNVMTCLTITPSSMEEAVARNADLVVAHHPLPFRPLKRLTTGDTTGRMLLRLIEASIAVYSPHTAFDSAGQGINQQLAERLRLTDIVPLQVNPADPDGLGSGRYGRLPEPRRLSDIASQLKEMFALDGLHQVGSDELTVECVAVACGSAGQFLDVARHAGCDMLVTGETTFHTCLEAEATGMALLLPGHYASERFAVETLAQRLGDQFPDITVWASKTERDPLRWV